MSTLKTSGVNTILWKKDITEAVFLVNNYLKSDATLQSYFNNKLNLFPLVADGPAAEGEKSYPYIRYVTIPGTYFPWRARSDIVRYFVGDNKWRNGGKILERLIDLLNIDDAPGGVLPLRGGNFLVQSIVYLGGSIPSGPDQDQGIIERGINVAIVYTKL